MSQGEIRALEELVGSCRTRRNDEPEMSIRGHRSDAPARRSLQQALLDQGCWLLPYRDVPGKM